MRKSAHGSGCLSLTMVMKSKSLRSGQSLDGLDMQSGGAVMAFCPFILIVSVVVERLPNFS
ncbi:hypothetical protein BLAT2472_260003 [Burkholderia latens]